ncbi:TlpA family protein disulfide reductase [Sphingobacterium corticibacterium]|uniref:TlpA family protein disulfide reductase n=1 Tax=Sphingobacterium corticibacterium TaxID=2484746 RepID=A0A4Q6XUC9_9SPHI|nr:TlpA disulfide reductase family protein [Sphingobacterium corticibacterium]RZF60227.1 TlpA family protein disulfide reductase [Sphingobacterium corticibacterium]
MMVIRTLFLTVLVVLLTLSAAVYGQDRVNIKINLSGIDREKLVVHFDDGIVLDIINLNQGDSTIVVDRPTYTRYPSMYAQYDGKYYQEFFINSPVAVLNLFYDLNRKNVPFYADCNINITAIYDTVSNEIYRDLRIRQKDELLKLNDLFTKHGAEIRTNDSVEYEFNQLTRLMNANSMEFLKPYAEDFFSFYYFKDQILASVEFIEDYPEYYMELLAYYNDTFPEEFRATGEGKKVVDGLLQKISPVLLKEGATMPDIHFRDLYGDTVLYKNQKENFVLLDFWASWCGPCIQQIPDIKALRKEFPENRLKIVGISIDRDSTSFINSIEEHKMDWIHSLDRGSLLSGKLGINTIPRVVLLNRSGRIVYNKRGGRLDMEKIRAILGED